MPSRSSPPAGCPLIEPAGTGRVLSWPLALAALLALVLRWWNVDALQDTVLYRTPHGDGKAYLDLATRLREGGWAGLFHPGDVYYQAPLYPHVVALFQSAFGESLIALRHFQACLGAGATFLIGLGTARLFGQRAGVIAALLLATYAPGIWLDGLIQKTALSSLLVAAVIALWTYRSKRATIALGACMGLLMLTRGEARLLALVVGAGVALRSSLDSSWRARATRLTPFVVGLVLVILPVFVRNGVLGGDWVLTTSQSGTNFYIGNQAGSLGTYSPLVNGRGDATFEASDAKTLAEEAAGHVLAPREVSSYWRGRAMEEIAENPGAAAARFGKKAVLAFNNAEVADTDDLQLARRDSPVLRWALPFSFVLTAAALGLALAYREERRRARMLVALGVTQWVALVLFFIFARYRIPLALFLTPLAGLGLASVARLRSQPGWGLAAVIAAFTVAFLPVHDARQGTAGALVNAATLSVRSEQYAAALDLADEAVSLSPRSFETQKVAALVRLKLGRSDEAYPFLKAAHSFAPADWQVRAWLGIARGERGDLAGALELLAPAARERPEAMPIVSNAVALAIALDQPGPALELLRARIAAYPDEADTPLRLQLAWILSTARDPALRDGAEALTVLEGAAAGARTDDVRAAALAELGRMEEARSLTNNAAHRATYAKGQPLRE